MKTPVIKPPRKKEYAIHSDDRMLTYGILTEKVMSEARVRQDELGGRIGTHLFDLGLISRFTLTNLLNRQAGLPMIRVADDLIVKTNAVAGFPRNLALRYKVMPMSSSAEQFTVGAIDMPPEAVIVEISGLVRKPVRVLILPESVFYQLSRDYLQIPTDFFAAHVDPAKVPERPFQEGLQQGVPRDLILFEVAGISLAYVRRKKTSKAKRLGDMLVEDGLVTQAELETVLAKYPGMHVGEVMMEESLVDARILSRYLSRHADCATIDPYVPFKVDPEILALVHQGTARKFHVVPLALYEKNLLLLTPEADNSNLLQVVARESGHSIKPVVTPLACAKWLVEKFYPPAKVVKKP